MLDDLIIESVSFFNEDGIVEIGIWVDKPSDLPPDARAITNMQDRSLILYTAFINNKGEVLEVIPHFPEF